MSCICSPNGLIDWTGTNTDDDYLKIYFSPLNLNTDDRSLIKMRERKLHYNHDDSVRYNFVEDPSNVNSRIFNVTNTKPISFDVNDKHFELVEFHFHDHGENIIDNDRQAMEMHLVFEDPTNPADLAVLAFLLKEDRHKHAKSDKMIRKIRNNEKFKIPKIKNYFSYSGALTKPPTYPVPQIAVAWHVSTKYLNISKDDLEYFRANIDRASADIQKRNGRNISLVKHNVSK